MTTPAWIEGMRDAHPLIVGKALGLETREGRGASAGSMECPVCGARTRHTKSGDPRLAVGVAQDGRAHCWQCDEGLDALKIVAHAVDGGSLGPRAREWCERFLGIDGAAPAQRPPPRAAPRPADAPVYPPVDEVAAVFNVCERVDRVQLATWYLRERGIDAAATAALEMVRVLPIDPRILPRWAQGWARSEHRIVFPLFDAWGNLRSLLARLTRPTRPGERKSLAPSGFARAGLAVACPAARAMLRSAAHPPTWLGPSTMRVAIAEGEIDALVWATSGKVDATLGLFTGSFGLEHARRLPWGARVLVATDLDEAGDEMAKRAAHEMRAAERTDLEVTRWIAAA